MTAFEDFVGKVVQRIYIDITEIANSRDYNQALSRSQLIYLDYLYYEFENEVDYEAILAEIFTPNFLIHFGRLLLFDKVSVLFLVDFFSMISLTLHPDSEQLFLATCWLCLCVACPVFSASCTCCHVEQIFVFTDHQTGERFE